MGVDVADGMINVNLGERKQSAKASCRFSSLSISFGDGIVLER